MNSMYSIFYAAGVIGGVLLMLGPFVGTGRVAPRWIRTALWITGPACVVWGVLGYSLLARNRTGRELPGTSSRRLAASRSAFFVCSWPRVSFAAHRSEMRIGREMEREIPLTGG